MKIRFSPASPFVRKAMVCAAELGQTIETLPSAAGPVARDAAIIADNPLGQVPTFFTDDGTVLYDSRVICEYLDSQAGGSLFPKPGPARWRALVEQSLADGLLDALLLARYETVLRPAERQWPDWIGGQMAKVHSALDRMEAWAPDWKERVDIGTITAGCALGYADFRFPDLDWRTGRPALTLWYERFSARPSMQGSAPPAA